MRLTKLEWTALAVTVLGLSAMLVLFLSARATRPSVTVSVSEPTAAGSVDGAGSGDSAGNGDSTGSGEGPGLGEGTGNEVEFPLDINTATAEELQALPGIGAARAQAIVDYRAEHGPFIYVEQLRRVSGIGEKLYAGIADYITVGERDDG